ALLASAKRPLRDTFVTTLHVAFPDGRPERPILTHVGAQYFREVTCPDSRRIVLLFDSTPSPYPPRNQVISLTREGAVSGVIWDSSLAPHITEVGCEGWSGRLWGVGKRGPFSQLHLWRVGGVGWSWVPVTRQSDGDVREPVF